MGKGAVSKSAAVAAILVVVSVVTWFVAQEATISPNELAARLGQPEFPPITVLAERRMVRAEIVTRGSLVFDEEQTLTLSGPVGIPGSSEIVTSVPMTGDRIDAGGVLIEVAYRPVLLLQSPRPLVRDLAPGDSGPDVEALQSALSDIGLLAADEVDGRYGTATGSAVDVLYELLGYRPPSRGVVMAELILVSDTPVIVREVLVQVGQRLGTSLDVLRVSRESAHLAVGARPFEIGQIEVGARVRIFDELGGEILEGRVSSLGDRPDPDSGLVPVRVEFDGQLDEGRDYRVTITVDASEEAALAVPETALYTGSGGVAYVLKLDGSEPERVDVRTGVTGSDGYTEVVPLNGVLEEGDALVIGAEP